MTVLLGDCLDSMAAMDADSVDSIVSDPPYGLAFMGKVWDHGVPGEQFWREALRVAKPGAYLVAFGGTRTFHRLTCAIEDAGWEIRDCLSWLYGSGFPKSHNGPWGGTALKPAWEPIILARKPLIGTVAKNVTQHGTGGLNVDGCRIGTELRFNRGMTSLGVMHDDNWIPVRSESAVHGRWPANVCLDEEAAGMLDEQTGTLTSGKGDVSGKIRSDDEWGMSGGAKLYGDSGGASRFFYCAKASRREREAGLDRTCTVKHITGLCRQDNEVLVALLQRATSDTAPVSWVIGESGESILGLCQSDSLSTTLTAISRITPSQICNWWTPSLTSESTAVANSLTANGGSLAASAESESPSSLTTTSDGTESVRGVSGVVSLMLSAISDGANWSELRNIHSTVKPIALMRWLCRLVTPPNGLVLDPFTGSGTTGCAAVLEGFRFIGCEKEAEYVAIAEKRIAHWAGQIDSQGTLL